MKTTDMLDRPLEHAPCLLSPLFLKTHKTWLQEKAAPCLKLKLLRISLDLKWWQPVLLHWDDQMKRGENVEVQQTTSYPNGGQSFPTLLTIDAQFPRTSQRYLHFTMSSVQLSLSFMDLRFTAVYCHKSALFSECPVPTKILFKQAAMCLQC